MIRQRTHKNTQDDTQRQREGRYMEESAGSIEGREHRGHTVASGAVGKGRRLKPELKGSKVKELKR